MTSEPVGTSNDALDPTYLRWRRTLVRCWWSVFAFGVVVPGIIILQFTIPGLRPITQIVLLVLFPIWCIVIGAISVVVIAALVRTLIIPEPVTEYSFRQLAGWWPFPQLIAILVYLVGLIFVFGLGYWYLEAREPGVLLYDGELVANNDLLQAVFFSATTFTTTGYGDFTITGAGRFFAVVEMLTGYIVFGIVVAGVFALLTSHPVKATGSGNPTSGDGHT